MMKSNFYDSLEYAFELRGNIDKFHNAKRRIESISDYGEIKKILNNPEDELYQWIPTIVFNLFGYETYKNCDLNVDEDETFMLFRPNSIYDFSVIEELYEKNMEIHKYEYRFSPWLIASIYGGFPWFFSYIRTCERLDILNKTSYVYKIKSKNGEACVNRIVKMKNRFRNLHPEQTVKILLPNEEYDGVIHSFHTPNCIENRMQTCAVDREIEGLR